MIITFVAYYVLNILYYCHLSCLWKVIKNNRLIATFFAVRVDGKKYASSKNKKSIYGRKQIIENFTIEKNVAYIKINMYI
jgi:hypothetical protein